MQIDIAGRMAAVKPSATMTITAKADDMRRKGVDVVSLSAGAPDFPPPTWALEAAHTALTTGATGYTAVDGTPELKEAIRNKFQRENDLSFSMEQIVVSNGAKHSIYNAIAVLCDAGDEVIVPAPYWVSYPAMVQLVGAHPRIIPTNVDNRFKVTPGQLEEHLNEKTRLLLLNSPGNPSGQVYSAAEYSRIADVVRRFSQITVLCDDIYEHVYWGDEPYRTFAQAAPDLADRTVTVNGLSKAFAMTGFRIGYCGAPAAVARAMRTFQGQTAGCPNSIAQAASVEALKKSAEFVPSIGPVFQDRHQRVYECLNRIPGLRLTAAQGAFYAFADCRGAMARLGIPDDVSLAESLLDHAHVAVVPGSAFGVPAHIRVSFATSDAQLEKALTRIEKFFNR